MPSESANEPGGPIIHWEVPFKLTFDKSLTVGQPELQRALHLSFVDTTSLNVNNHAIFAKHILNIDTSAIFPHLTAQAKKLAAAQEQKAAEQAAMVAATTKSQA